MITIFDYYNLVDYYRADYYQVDYYRVNNYIVVVMVLSLLFVELNVKVGMWLVYDNRRDWCKCIYMEWLMRISRAKQGMCLKTEAQGWVGGNWTEV